MYVRRKKRLITINIIGVPLHFIWNQLTLLSYRIVWIFWPNKYFTTIKYCKSITNLESDYVFDELERETTALSPKLSFLTGHSPEFLNQNFTPYSPSIVLERDAEIYSNIFIPQIIKIFSNIPQQERGHYSLRCNFRIKHKDNSIRTLFQRTVFTETANNGKLITSASLIEDITEMTQYGVMNGWLDKRIPETYSSLHLGTFNTNLTHNLFSKRETEILELMAEGLPIKQIADRLNISIKTVDRHKENIRNKTGAKNSIELIKIALKSGIIK